MMIPLMSRREMIKNSPMTISLIFCNLFIYLLLLGVPQKKATFQTVNEHEQLLERLDREMTSRHDVEDVLVKKLNENTQDMVALEELQQHLKKVIERFETTNFFRFGLSQKTQYSLSWLTYQFTHAGWFHLASNMIFLLLIGLVLESIIGSLALLFLYLAGGIVGGYLFLLTAGNSFAPVVGASASMSALIAAYPFFEPRRHVRFYYMLVPFERWHGFIWISAFYIYPLFIFSDLSSLLLSLQLQEKTSIAYVAHYGGILVGVFFGAISWLKRGLKEKSLL